MRTRGKKKGKMIECFLTTEAKASEASKVAKFIQVVLGRALVLAIG
jgi:hypothetical protein